MEGESQGNNKTTLVNWDSLFPSREGPLIDSYQGHIHKQNKIKTCWWLKQRKHTLDYGVTNINELKKNLQVKLYKGKVALGYSQIAVCLVIKKEQEQSINTEHLKDEFYINFGEKDWWIPETIVIA